MDMEADDTEMESVTESEMDSCGGSTTASSSIYPDSASFSKRLAMKNTIQTNFGEDYVFQIASSPDLSNMAVSLSTDTIKLYLPATGQFLGECRGHRGTIHEISFEVPSLPNLLCSCSSDSTVRMWDIRTFKQVSSIKAGCNQEIFSFSIGGSSNNLLAGGGNSQIFFWDLRNGKQVACLEESHMEDVTQVRFVPNQQNKLISSSVDGLLCLFDTDGNINDDDHLQSVMNVGTSIGRFGFFGDMNQRLWCLTHIETLSIWDWVDGRREMNFEDARSVASNKWNLDHIDYFVDCHYSEVEDGLWVIGGTGAGSLGFFPVSCKPPFGIGAPEAILDGGHAGIVRSVLPVSTKASVIAQKNSVFGWTGGEDGRLVCWLSDGNSATNRSWITSSLVMKSPRARGKSRHKPY